MVIKYPVILLSCGEYVRTKRLFAYNRDSNLLVPMFTDLRLAHPFAKAMSNIVRAQRGKYSVMSNLCESAQKLLDIVTLLTVTQGDSCHFVINPSIPSPVGDAAGLEMRLPVLELMEVLQNAAGRHGMP